MSSRDTLHQPNVLCCQVHRVDVWADWQSYTVICRDGYGITLCLRHNNHGPDPGPQLWSFRNTSESRNNMYLSTTCICVVDNQHMRPRQSGHHFINDTLKRIFLNENVRIAIKISLNVPALVQLMAWHRPGDKSLSKPMVVKLPTHICVILPQCVNSLRPSDAYMRR